MLRRLTNIRTVEDALVWNSAWPLVLFLNTSDGGVGAHAVTVFQDEIYEPNSEFALTKTVESLNWAGGDNCVVTGVKRVFQVLPRSTTQAMDEPPLMYTIDGHGLGWDCYQRNDETVDDDEPIQVQLLSGDSVLVAASQLEPLLF